MNESALALPTDSVDSIRELGKLFARSAMFGCDTEEQGAMLAITCAAEGMSPLSFRRQWHMLDGDFTMRADAMLAGFMEKGGRYRIVQRDEKAAKMLAWTIDDDGHPSNKEEAYEWIFAWDDAVAQELPFKKRSGKPTKELKHNWRTIPKQMLWARCVSDMVRTLRPGVVCGAYTPEEATDFGAEDHKGVPGVDAKPVQAEVKTSKPAKPASKPKTKPAAKPARKEEPEVIDIEATEVTGVEESIDDVGICFPELTGALAKMSGLPVSKINAKQCDWLFNKGKKLDWWTNAYQSAVEQRAQELAAE